MFAKRALLCVVMAAVTLACRPRTDAAVPAPDRSAPVLVEVVSHFEGDVVIYLLRAGSHRQRLGSVTGLSGAAFTVPWSRLEPAGSSRLQAYPIAGSRSFTSEPLILQAGQSVRWTLEADLDQSTLVLY